MAGGERVRGAPGRKDGMNSGVLEVLAPFFLDTKRVTEMHGFSDSPPLMQSSESETHASR